MKITIDTKEDTHEDIKKVLHILTNIIERKGYNEDINSNYQTKQTSTPADTSNMMNMFNDTSTSAAETTTSSNQMDTNQIATAPDFSSFTNLIEKKEQEKKEEPKLEFF